jgi:hypothetical protein
MKQAVAPLATSKMISEKMALWHGHFTNLQNRAGMWRNAGLDSEWAVIRKLAEKSESGRR